MGGSASSVSANSDGTKPVPRIGMTSASTASEGSVRPMLAAVIAVSAARGLSASSMPAGTAIGDREPERRRRQRDVNAAARRRTGRDARAMNCQASTSMAAGYAVRRRSQRSSDARRKVRGHRERAGGQRAGPDLRRVVVADAVEDQRAEAARVDVGRDDRDADHGDRRDAQPGDDDGQRERQLDARQDLAARSCPCRAPRRRRRPALRGCRSRRCGSGSSARTRPCR